MTAAAVVCLALLAFFPIFARATDSPVEIRAEAGWIAVCAVVPWTVFLLPRKKLNGAMPRSNGFSPSDARR